MDLNIRQREEKDEKKKVVLFFSSHGGEAKIEWVERDGNRHGAEHEDMDIDERARGRKRVESKL